MSKENMQKVLSGELKQACDLIAGDMITLKNNKKEEVVSTKRDEKDSRIIHVTTKKGKTYPVWEQSYIL